MSRTNHVDVAILGAGIGGLSLADHLLTKGVSCAVVDTKSPGSGASGAPLMLMHPATGRRAKMAWRAEECIDSITQLFSRLTEFSDDHFFEPGHILRPALTPEIAEDFSRSPEKYDWSDEDWVTWLGQSDFTEKYPYFKNNYGGLIVKKAATVNGYKFIKLLAEKCEEYGLNTYSNSGYSINQTKSGWKITLKSDDEVTANNLVFATGSSTAESEYWNFLPLNKIKGQTATFTFSEDLPLQNSVSSMGYLAYMKSTPNRIVVGSTYEHHFKHLRPDKKGEETLIKKLENTLPGWTDKITSVDQWAAVRVSSQDHNPVVGDHPNHENLFIIGALGSKGLLMGHYLAKCLADRITDGKVIPGEISTHRYFL